MKLLLEDFCCKFVFLQLCVIDINVVNVINFMNYSYIS